MTRWWLAGVGLVLSGCVTGVPAREAAQAYYDLGNAYTELDEHDKATTAYLHALQLDSSLFQASYNLARAYIETGQYNKATKLLEELLSRDRENTVTLDTLGYNYFRQNKLDRALGYYQQVLAFSPEDKNALFDEGVVYEKQKDYDKALAAFQKVYDMDADTSALAHMGAVDLAAGDTEAGIKFLNAYLDKKSDDFEITATVGEAYEKVKRYDKALASFQAALALQPKSARILFDQAYVWLTAIDDEEDGVKSLEDAIDAGFKDVDRLKALLAEPTLVDPQRITALLKDKNLLPPPAPPAPKTKSS